MSVTREQLLELLALIKSLGDQLVQVTMFEPQQDVIQREIRHGRGPFPSW